MINVTDVILVLILLSVLLSLASNRLMFLVQIMVVQGILVSLLPLLLEHYNRMGSGGLMFAQLTILIKGVVIPSLLYVALKRASIQREVEPIIGYHASLLFGLVILLLSVFLANRLHPYILQGNDLLLTAGVSTAAVGFFLMMGRRKAITQVIGYLMLENGIYLIGTALTQHRHTVYVVEFGVLLDLLVGVMIIGIILHNINKSFDDIDTDLLNRLKD